METNSYTKDQLIQDWLQAQKDLNSLKEKELRLRNLVVNECFANHKEKGTEYCELGNGYKLKGVFKQNHSFINSNKNDEVDTVLSKMEKTGVEGQVIAERLIKWKPELSLTEYNNLSDKFKKMIDSILIVKPGTPTLELIEPKVK